ncbi:hypothetical protein GIW05_00005 [Pseudomonas syringae]|uniref:hypothetical protein n=1 Tax=Pseudomonas syringae TaxID=317 RepID=UPI001F2CE395|nr:hypothetical protein [Pseudomonas syringae]MCF5381904.1 hypothetical protein [Pseudomonas syringae]MCF5424046.1 hypothetical protein [Pseudomonas syringae]MCF5454919.1 hypothetical protein [Pseudomonas syringae]MCF5459257.1 hypothetical protein [Pseudomonas syringae]
MSRHYILLPAKLPSGTAAIVCGYDRHPAEHYFLNICASMSDDDLAEPLWASILVEDYSVATVIDSFDGMLVNYGIVLPEAYKDALREEWNTKPMRRVVHWNSDGTIDHEEA